MKLVVLAFLSMAVTGFALAGPQPTPYWSCDTVERTEIANKCRARCRETSDARNKACDDAYRQCGLGCSSGSGFTECRKACRETYQTCRQNLPQELERCANACVTDNGCQL